jgi:hypothetical protein
MNYSVKQREGISPLALKPYTACIPYIGCRTHSIFFITLNDIKYSF